jgi:hypothetical protein
MSTIPPAVALKALEAVIRQGTVQVSVLPMNWIQLQSAIPSLGHSPFLKELVARAPEKDERASAGKDTLTLELLQAMDTVERHQTLTDRLQGEAARVLRLPPAELDVTRPLNQFGMDSLMALELKNRMQSQWGITVPLVSILSGPPVTGLVSILETLVDAQKNLLIAYRRMCQETNSRGTRSTATRPTSSCASCRSSPTMRSIRC